MIVAAAERLSCLRAALKCKRNEVVSYQWNSGRIEQVLQIGSVPKTTTIYPERTREPFQIAAILVAFSVSSILCCTFSSSRHRDATRLRDSDWTKIMPLFKSMKCFLATKALVADSIRVAAVIQRSCFKFSKIFEAKKRLTRAWWMTLLWTKRL